MTAIVSSLGAPLVPRIALDHGVDLPTAQLTLIATLVVGAVANPLLGRWGAGPRRRAALLAGLAVVAAGCALAALPLGFGWLLAGRALQGVGLALNPLAFAEARARTPSVRAARVVALLAAINVAGGGLGYVVTGLVARWGGVAACFVVGLVLTVLAWTLVALVVDEEPGPNDVGQVDWWGAAELGTGCALLLVLLNLGGAWGWATVPSLCCLAAGCVLVAAWWRRSLRVRRPLVDLRLAVAPGTLVIHLTALTVGTGMYVVMTTLVMMVQAPAETGYGLGRSVVVAGALLVPYAAGSVLGSRLLVLLGGRLTAAGTLGAGCLVLVAGACLLGLRHGTVADLYVGFGVVGLGSGCTFAAMPGLLVLAVPRGETSSAIAFNLVLRYLGFAAGSALCVALLRALSGGGDITAGAVEGTLWAAAGIWLLAWAGTAASGLGRRLAGGRSRRTVL